MGCVSSRLKKPLQICAVVLSLVAIPSASHAAMISFTVGTTNATSGDQIFGFTYILDSIDGAYNTATASLSLTLTPPSGGTASVGVSGVQPFFLSASGLTGGIATNLGVDVGTTCAATTGISTTCVFTAGNTFASTMFDALRVDLIYTQTGGGSSASVSGTVTLTQETTVPEPATLLLLGMGALGAGVRRPWRQKRT